MSKKDLYSILGVDKTASDDEIKKAFRKQSLIWHPDKHSTDSDEDKKKAEEKFKEISEAYNILHDSKKRQQYDNFGTIDGSGSFDFDVEDVMNEFLKRNGFGNFSSQKTYSAYNRGSDKKIKINVSIEDVYFERFKDVSYEIYVSCDECDGRGSSDGRDIRCPYCGGTGTITKTINNGYQRIMTQEPCRNCGGTGYYVENPCQHCGGTGIVSEKVTRGFKVPKIDKLGYTYRLECEGNACRNNRGSNGDLVYCFSLKEDTSSKFSVDKNDYRNLVTTIDVNAFECITGCNKTIKSIEGTDIMLKIPQGTKDGSVFSFNGYGFNCSNGYKGKLLVKVNMIMPELTEEQKNKLKEITKEL